MSRFSGRTWLQDLPLAKQLFIRISLLSTLIGGLCFLYLAFLLKLRFPAALLIFLRIWFLMLALNLVAARWLSAHLLEPFEKITCSMAQIRKKIWTERIYQLSRKDEIGQIVNQLSDIQERVTEINEDEEFFYQCVSHGLQTPLMVIQNCCAAYSDGISEGDEAIGIIMKESRTLEEGIKKLLYVTSFDHVLEKNSEFTRLDLGQLLQDISLRYAQRLLLERIRFDFDVPKGTMILGDLESLRVLFGNIVENSIRYVRSYVHISLVETADSYTIRIDNDGEPIKGEILESLFERFYKGPKGNFGLGLYIARKIAFFHEGELWANNLEDGVRFCVRLKKEGPRMAQHAAMPARGGKTAGKSQL